jgi:hypothetical protein
MGRFDLCWPIFERSIRLAREHNQREMIGAALLFTVISAYYGGGGSQAPMSDLRQAALEAIEIFERIDNPVLKRAASLSLARALYLNGDYAGCEAHLTEGLASASEVGAAGDWLVVLAESCLARGDIRASVANAKKAVPLVDSRPPLKTPYFE